MENIAITVMIATVPVNRIYAYYECVHDMHNVAREKALLHDPVLKIRMPSIPFVGFDSSRMLEHPSFTSTISRGRGSENCSSIIEDSKVGNNYVAKRRETPNDRMICGLTLATQPRMNIMLISSQFIAIVNI